MTLLDVGIWKRLSIDHSTVQKAKRGCDGSMCRDVSCTSAEKEAERGLDRGKTDALTF